MRRTAEVLLLCAAIALLMGADANEARFQRLGDKIMCSCGCAQMLLKCNHIGCPNSARMIGQLRALTGAVTSGPASGEVATELKMEPDDQGVLNFFRNTWGVTAVVEPATHGFELWVWVLPPLVIFTALVILSIILILKWLDRRARQPVAVMPLDPHLDALAARARRETEI
jgi:cytochrome c-type biogenesis protein CcmH